MWPTRGFHALISLLLRSEFNLSGMLVPETWAWGLSYHSLNQEPPLGLVCYASWQLPKRHCWSHFTDWETDVQLLLSHQLKLNYNTCGSLKKYSCYNQRHMQLSVCGEGWGRQKAGHSDEGLGKKALDPSTCWVVGLIVSPLPRGKKKIYVCSEVRICLCLEIE